MSDQVMIISILTSMFRKLSVANEKLKRCEWQLVFDAILATAIHHVFERNVNYPLPEKEVRKSPCARGSAQTHDLHVTNTLLTHDYIWCHGKNLPALCVVMNIIEKYKRV